MPAPASGAAEPSGRGGTTLSFSAFVLSLTRTAAVHFADVADPATGVRGVLNLQGAAQMIDILALLEEKTRGNLSAEERQLLEQVLDELRARYAAASRPTA
jgi:hypothetical protein